MQKPQGIEAESRALNQLFQRQRAAMGPAAHSCRCTDVSTACAGAGLCTKSPCCHWSRYRCPMEPGAQLQVVLTVDSGQTLPIPVFLLTLFNRKRKGIQTSLPRGHHVPVSYGPAQQEPRSWGTAMQEVPVPQCRL